MSPISIANKRFAFTLSTLALFILAGVGWNLRAEGRQHSTKPSAAGSKAAPPDNTAQQKTAHLKTDHVRYDERTSVATGQNFTYTVDDQVITGDNFRYNQDKGELDADGHLIFDDPDHHATSDRAHVNNKTKFAEFTGHVVLVLKPKAASTGAPSGQTASQTGAETGAHPTLADDPSSADKKENVSDYKKHGVTVTCDRLEDQYKKKYVKLFGHLLFKQRYVDEKGKTIERTLTAEHAEYDGKAEKMVLFPPVDGYDNKQGKYKSDLKEVIVGTKEGAETIESEGQIQLEFPVQEETDDSSSSNTKASSDTKAGGSAQPANPPKDKPIR